MPLRIELIVVDDASNDGTRDILQRSSGAADQGAPAAEQRARAPRCAAGSRSDRRLIVIQDADLEYSPEEFPELIELICEGRADVVYGSRFLGRHRVFLFTHYLATGS